jgi:hypothetical protein
MPPISTTFDFESYLVRAVNDELINKDLEEDSRVVGENLEIFQGEDGEHTSNSSRSEIPPGHWSKMPSMDLETPIKTPIKRTSGKIAYRKLQSRKNRTVMRKLEKANKSIGEHRIRHSTARQHVNAAKEINTDLKYEDLKVVTTTGYTGTKRDEKLGGRKKTYTLNQLVGETSLFKYKVYEWDGRLVY